MKVVVVGAGIVGASTAYHLTQRGVETVLVEAAERVAAAASGKAGGFLARGWGDGYTEQLHHQGFDLHEQLAKTLEIESYRKIPTLSVSGRGRRANKAPDWISSKKGVSVMDNATAQVSPNELTVKLTEAAVSRGAELILGKPVCGLEEENQKVIGVILEGGDVIQCTHVVFTMGPWGSQASNWLNINIPMTGIKSTSLVFPPTTTVTNDPHALFCEEDNNGCHLEVYPRPNGEVYVCGCGGSDHVTGARLLLDGDCGDASKIKPATSRCAAAVRSLREIVPEVDSQPTTTQACMRPILPDGLPMMGPVESPSNAFICCGHNCWGILWGPVSGLLMAQLVCGEEPDIDLAPFAPDRFSDD